MKNHSKLVVLAAVAHPDDIELSMMGTILRLRRLGLTVHFWNLANGCLGTTRHSREDIIAMRREEARTSAATVGAHYHDALFDDLGIFYDAASLARVSAVVRTIKPDIILTHPVQDYMEDHVNTCRLVTTAAFARSAVNYTADPVTPACTNPVRIYHVLPHGIKGKFSELPEPDFFVDIGEELEQKKALMEIHTSQIDWLNVTQSASKLTDEIEQVAAQCGALSKRFRFAEAWFRHSHVGFCEDSFDPLPNLLTPDSP